MDSRDLDAQLVLAWVLDGLDGGALPSTVGLAMNPAAVPLPCTVESALEATAVTPAVEEDSQATDDEGTGDSSGVLGSPHTAAGGHPRVRGWEGEARDGGGMMDGMSLLSPSPLATALRTGAAMADGGRRHGGWSAAASPVAASTATAAPSGSSTEVRASCTLQGLGQEGRFLPVWQRGGETPSAGQYRP